MNKECSTCVFGNNLKLKENTTYCDLWELEFASNDKCSFHWKKALEERPVWHSLKDNPTDIPKQVGWYACKVKSSDDLRMVFGSSEITSDKYDAWLRIECSL